MASMDLKTGNKLEGQGQAPSFLNADGVRERERGEHLRFGCVRRGLGRSLGLQSRESRLRDKTGPG